MVPRSLLRIEAAERLGSKKGEIHLVRLGQLVKEADELKKEVVIRAVGGEHWGQNQRIGLRRLMQ